MVTKYISMDAHISKCEKYRYSLTRDWDEALPTCCFIGLNPSTADANEDDPTIRRCVRFASDWGCGKLIMVNLWPIRATQPEDMKEYFNTTLSRYFNIQHLEELIHVNWLEIKKASTSSKFTIAAWGNDGGFRGMDKLMQDRVKCDIQCLKINSTGHPAHPLYLKANLKPIPFNQGEM